MATGISQSLGSVLIHGYTAAGVFYEPYLTETYEVATNTSTLSIAHRIRIMEEWGGRYDIPDATPIYVTIDGTTTTHTFSSMPSVYPNNQAVTVQTTQHTVTHNSDGQKTITISCRWNNSSASYQGATSSLSVKLTTIPRASTMSFATSQTMGNSYTFTITRASSSFTHTITWAFGGSSGTAVSSTSSTTPSFTPAIATFAPKCTNATSATITYTLNTYSGGSLIGSKAYTAMLAVPSSVVPSVTLSTSAINPFNSLYLQGKSSVKLTATGSVSSDYGATIRSYSFQVLNAASTAISSGSTSTSSTSATHTSGILSGSGTHTCKVTITDSRGRTATATRTISVTAYSKPVWGTVSAYRSDSSGTSADEGTSITLTANASYSAVSGNSLTMTYRYKESTASSWSSATSYTNGATTVIGSNFDITKAYTVQVNATDTVGNPIQIDVPVFSSAVGMHYRKRTNTLGLLRYAPTGSSDSVYMPKGYAYGPDGATFSKLITRDDIGSGTTNDLLFTIPRTAYWDFNASDAFTADTAQKWLKYVTATYGSRLGSDRMVINTLVAGTRVVIIGCAYSWTDTVNDMPKYAWFRAWRYDFREVSFVSNNGAFYMHGEGGYTITNTLATKSVPSGTATVVGTQTLAPGTWLVIGSINWAVNGSGYRQVAFANGANPSRMDFVTSAPANASGKQSAQQIVKIFASDSEQTVTLYGLQNSGSALTVYPYIQATCIV